MINQGTLLAISVAYIAILFGVAYGGDRRASLAGARPRSKYVYCLALAIYCTSWTFYGAVGRATSSGWDFLPIYLGPAFVFVFGFPVLQRIIRISKGNNITSVADFIGARYGRHQVVPLSLSIIATFGIVPYIALQLKAISFGFDVIVGQSSTSTLGIGATLALAAVMAVFAILFGTRELSATENHHGMVLAMAFESLVKLVAFSAVGLFAIYLLSQRTAEPTAWIATFQSSAAANVSMPNFVTQTVLAAFAIVCLPRQFHLAVVEHSSPSDLRTARWVFPLYLLLVSVFVIPIAEAGRTFFSGTSTLPDTFVLALPLKLGQPWLGLVAYIGGFSAATGMVIVETIAISTMISNEIVMPFFLRSNRLARVTRMSVPAVLKLVRRVTVIAIIALAYLYYSLFTSQGTLAQIGLLSFAAVAQFAPSLIGGVFWKGGSYLGAVAGLISGSLVWGYTLLLPATAQPYTWAMRIVDEGPLGLGWLRPQALFGLELSDPLTHGVFWSLATNLCLYIGLSQLRKPGLRELLQAANFLNIARPSTLPSADLQKSSATVGDLEELAHRFLGSDRADELFERFRANERHALQAGDPLFPGLARTVEHALAGVIGASSARLVLSTTLRGKNMRPEDVVRLLDETSHAILFTRELMRTALEHLPQGISVVDDALKLVAWNQRYIDLFGYPSELAVVGRPIEDLIRFNAQRGWLVTDDIERSIARRISYMRAGVAYSHERLMPNGVVLEMRGNPLPGGGFVTSYSDVTPYKEVQAALQDANVSLERRVDERTAELMQLNQALADSKRELEKAHQSKTRFLAAASHDLTQPITAARLFLSSIDKQAGAAPSRSLLERAEGALGSAEDTLRSLLDFNRLDGGAERPRLEHFELGSVLRSLHGDFAIAAHEKGLDFRVVGCTHVVYSDAHLLRRVLQNFVANAIRYTDSGRVVVGCRRRGDHVSIHVMDSGPGIDEALHAEIFHEYRRFADDDRLAREGLGLGLAIAKRISELLGHPITLRSVPGRGSNFAIRVPLGARAAIVPSVHAADARDRSFSGKSVCCVEDEPKVLDGLRELLESWGCRTSGFPLAGAALDQARRLETVPDLLIIDYHLDNENKGLDIANRLRAIWKSDVPVIVLTAADLHDDHVRAQSGVVRIMRKPLRPGSLRAVMDVVLS